MFGIKRIARQPVHQPGETRWRLICDMDRGGGNREPAEYTHWRRGKPVIYLTQEAAERQADEVRSWNPGMAVRVEPTTEPVPPSSGNPLSSDYSSYTSLNAIPLLRQITRNPGR